MFAPLLAPPFATLAAPAVTVKRGGSATGSATVTFPAGFHAYQNPPKNDGEFPLSLSSPRAPKGWTLDRFTYPPGVPMRAAGLDSLVYDKAVKVTFRIAAARAVKPGTYNLPLAAAYQLCTETMCLAPGAAKATLRVRVTAG